jgi:hypothetical protein
MPRVLIVGDKLPSGFDKTPTRMDKSSIGKKRRIEFDIDSEEERGKEESSVEVPPNSEAEDDVGSDEFFQIINTAGNKVPKPSFHHSPPTPFVFQPIRMAKDYGIGFGSPDEIDISKANLAKQIEYWERGPEEKPHFVINSIKANVEEKSPYGRINWRDKGPMVGVYKRRGTTAGQAVWMTLAEAQVVVKLGINIVHNKGIELESGKKPGDSSFVWDYNSIPFQPRDFVNLKVPTDYVIDEPWGNGPNADSVSTKLCAQLNQPTGGSEVYPFGTMELLVSSVDKRVLIGLLKAKGFGQGQRVWMSIHEFQHLLAYLNQTIKDEVIKLDGPGWSLFLYDFKGKPNVCILLINKRVNLFCFVSDV